MLFRYYVICFLLFFSGNIYSSNLSISDSLTFLTGLGINEENDGAAVVGFRYALDINYQVSKSDELVWTPNIFTPPQILDDINADLLFFTRGELYYESFSNIEWSVGYRSYVWSINEVNKLTDFFNTSSVNPLERLVLTPDQPLSFKAASYFGDFYIESIISKASEPVDIPDRATFADTTFLQPINNQTQRFIDSDSGNVNIGVKIFYPLSNWDSSFYIYRGFNQRPIYNIERNLIDPLVFENVEQVFSPKNIFGVSFLGSAFGTTVKTEIINVIDDYRDEISGEGNYFQGVIGLEKTALNKDVTTTYIIEYLNDTRETLLPFESFMRENISAAINSDFSQNSINVILGYQGSVESSSYFTTIGFTLGKKSTLSLVYFVGKIEDEFILEEGDLSGLVITWGNN